MKNWIYVFASTIFLLNSVSCKKDVEPTLIKSPTVPAGGLVTPPVMPTLPAPSASAVTSGSGANPSQHLSFQFPSDGVLKMIDIGIIQSGMSEYFSTINFNGGYCGLQQTSDPRWNTPNIAISSLWNSSTNGNSNIDYVALGITEEDFGGEGTEKKTIGAYGWQLNHWYRMAVRAWKVSSQIYIGTFIQDMSNGTWKLFSVTDVGASSGFLGSGLDAFLENWDGLGGPIPKAAYLKDAWNLNAQGVWETSTSRQFSANSGDQGRNKDFDNAFNAFYDARVDGYLFEHGGNVKPNSDFNGGRILNLQAQTSQGATPASIPTGSIKSVTASYNSNQVTVNWVDDLATSPQLSYTVQVIDSSGNVVGTSSKTQPWITSVTIPASLNNGNSYTAKVSITDIFNQTSVPVTASFNAR